MGFASS